MKFSEKLINLRKSKGLSQEDLAIKLDVSRQTISKWESDSTVPDMNKLMEIAKLFEVSLDELVNNIETSNPDTTYKESSVEKNNKKISIRIFVVGIIIACILCGIGFIKQKDAKKTDENSYNDAYALSVKKYNAAVNRVTQINSELEQLNAQKQQKQIEKNNLNVRSSNWFSESSRLTPEIYDLNVKIMNLESEESQLQNDSYIVYYTPVKPIKYLIFYYISAGVFVVASLTSLIYFLVTRRKK